MYQNIYITNRTPDDPSTVYVWDDKLGLVTYPYSDFDYAYKLDRFGTKETIFGDKVSRVFQWNENSPNIFESDISRETRVLTDLYLDSDDIATNHRVMIFDIEVNSVGGFASIDKAEKEITAIGIYAKERDEYVVYLLDPLGIIVDALPESNVKIVPCATEQELLESFLVYYKAYDPTILSGWNIAQYDIPYLYHRLQNVFDQDTASMLSPIGMIKYSTRREQYVIAGVSILDYYDMYQKFTYSRQPSYQLDAIGEYEVKMGKIHFDGTLDQLYKDDLNKFIEYNLRDVKIVVAIDKKMRLIDLVMYISHVGHTQYEDYKYSSKYIDGTIITYLHRQGRVVPNKRATAQAEMDERYEDDEEGFAGAYVKEPVPGLYEWVYNLDLQSLYPSIIMSLNISPETKIGVVKNWNLDQHLSGGDNTYIVNIGDVDQPLSQDEFNSFMKNEKFMISSNGILYRSDKVGIIPEILDKWFAERVQYKKLAAQHRSNGDVIQSEYFDKRQHVQKILLNSIYGVLGLPIFRFYDLDNALAVTATGQDIIKTTARYLNTQYQKITNENKDWCIYIDTDSVYFSAKPLIMNATNRDEYISETVSTALVHEEMINRFYTPMARRMFFCDKHRFVIRGEAVSETAFWVSKKRYAMNKVYNLEDKVLLQTPKMTVKGLDTVRSSFPKAFRSLMNQTLQMILNRASKSDVDDAILKFRTKVNTMSFSDIARNTSVSNISEHDDKKEKGYQHYPSGCSAHIKAAIAYNRWLRNNKLNKMYRSIKNGDKIKWTYLKKNPLNLPTMALKGYDDPPELVKYVETYLDRKMAFDRDLKNKLDDFYSSLSWGMIPTEVNQTINKFFG